MLEIGPLPPPPQGRVLALRSDLEAPAEGSVQVLYTTLGDDRWLRRNVLRLWVGAGRDRRTTLLPVHRFGGTLRLRIQPEGAWTLHALELRYVERPAGAPGR
jgi:hypothetical protein